MILAGAVVVAAALAPWVALLPLGGPAGVLAHVIALVAAFHGAGWLLGRLARVPADPLLAIQWGIAALIGVSGLAMVVRLDDLAAHATLVYGFAAVHSGALLAGFAAHRARIAALRPSLRIWLIPAIALAAIAALQVVAAAGQLDLRPFDDDGHVLAQLARLRETGALGDPIGYPRGTQLGGQLALGALATLGGDVHLAGLLEPLAMALGLALALLRLRGDEPAPEPTTPGLWALLIAIAGAALAYAPVDHGATWTAVGLVLALHAMLARAAPPAIPLGITAGALIALRFELAPIAVVALAIAWWGRRDRRHALILIGGVLAVVLPYLVARALAWRSVPEAAHALLAPSRGSIAVRLALYAAVLAACAPIVVLAWRQRAVRWLGVAAAFTIAGIASQLTGDRPYATHLLWVLAFAGGLIVVVELARAHRAGAGALIASLLVMALIHDGRESTGRKRWVRRYLDAAANLEYLRHVGDPQPVSSGYDQLLREVPAGETVAVWVARPERLPYGAPVRLVDLRTPRGARLRVHRWDDHRSRFEQLLAATGARYLLVEGDDKLGERLARDPIDRFVCGWRLPGCADDLELIAERHRTLAERGGVRLIELAP